MDHLTAHESSLDTLAGVIAELTADQWDRCSTCTEWTNRDVTGHVIWGLNFIGKLAQGGEFADRSGAPGAATPGTIAGDDPVRALTQARERTARLLTEPNLERPGTPRMRAQDPAATVRSFLDVLTFDTLIHAWDIAAPLGITLDPPAVLLDAVRPTAARVVVRTPAFFAPEREAPADADDLTKFAAFLGRAVPTS